MQYQENMLANQNVQDGYKVIIISDNLHFKGGVLTKTSAGLEPLDSGGIVYRLSLYNKRCQTNLCAKVSAGLKCLAIMAHWKPDIILFHGLNLIELTFVIAYKIAKPKTKLYLDSHSDKYNDQAWKSEAKTLFLKTTFLIYWMAIKKCINKIFYISIDCKDYLTEIYGLKEDEMEFFPLGGQILGDEEYETARAHTRAMHEYKQKDVLFVHAGKFSKEKLTLELLNAFTLIASKNAKLILAGALDEGIKKEALDIISKDQRILYLGWQDGKKLQKLLCASDCYIQPGTQSATLQSAICCRLPIIVAPHRSHYSYMKGNGLFVRNSRDLKYAIEKMLEKHAREQMAQNSAKISMQILDYKKIASRLYE